MSGDLEPGFWLEGRSYVDSAGWLKRWYEDGILRCTWHCIFANLGTVGPWRRWIRWWLRAGLRAMCHHRAGLLHDVL